MNTCILKEATIEYCENIYGLAFNYLKNNNDVELTYFVQELTSLENDIRNCDDKEILDGYKIVLEYLVSKIEGVINEQQIRSSSK